jgi:hypothetical protein
MMGTKSRSSRRSAAVETNMADETETLRDQVRQILLDDWDPSNASRSEAARGEYDGYIEPILQFIRSHVGEDAIVDYLYEREREIMCFPGLGKQHLRRVARRLVALKSA